MTYSDDRNFYCDVETLIGSIFARLAEFYDNDNIFIAQHTKDKIKNILFPKDTTEEQKME